MNADELEKALEFAKMFGKEYNKLQKDLEITQKNIRVMRDHLNEINRNLKGNINV